MITPEIIDIVAIIGTVLFVCGIFAEIEAEGE